MTAVPAQVWRGWAEWLFLVALALWTGAVLFYSGLVLPTLFSQLPSAGAGEIAALLFPPYYGAGLVLALIIATASAYLAAVVGGAWRWAFLVAVLMLAAQASSALLVGPRMAELRADPAARTLFMRMHGLAMALNALVLGGGLALLAATRRLLGRR